MAKSIQVSHSINLRYKLGVDNRGKDVFASQSFPIDKDVTDQLIVNFSDQIDDVIDYSISEIAKDVKYLVVS